MPKLDIQIGGNASGYFATLNQVRAASANFAQSLRGQLAAAAGGFSLFAAGRSALDYAGQINDLSERLGIGTEALQQFDFAAQLTGANLETLTGFLEKLSVAREQALDGNAELTRSFERLGVSLDDLRSKRLEELTRQVGRAVQGGNAEELLDPLRDVGGKGAGALIPAFKAGLEEVAQQARDAGAVISEADIAALDEAGDKFSVMAQTLRAQLAPAITFVSEMVMGLVNGIRRAGRFWGGFFGAAASASSKPGTAQESPLEFAKRVAKEAMEGGQQAAADFDTETETQQTAQEQATQERRNLAGGGRSAMREAERILQLREKLAKMTRDELPPAERRKAIEEEIARLRQEQANLAKNGLDELKQLQLEMQARGLEKELAGIKDPEAPGDKGRSGSNADRFTRIGVFSQRLTGSVPRNRDATAEAVNQLKPILGKSLDSLQGTQEIQRMMLNALT